MTPPEEVQQVDSAGLGVRVSALLVDLLVLFLLHIGSSLFIGALLIQTISLDLQQIIASALLYFIFLVFAPPILTLLYFTILHAWGGQTIGKMIFGLRIVSATGTAISGGVAFLRWAAAVASTLAFALGFIWAFFDKNHCTWHDRLSGTRIVVDRKILTSV